MVGDWDGRVKVRVLTVTFVVFGSLTGFLGDMCQCLFGCLSVTAFCTHENTQFLQSINTGGLKESNPFPSIIVQTAHPYPPCIPPVALTTRQSMFSGIQPWPAHAAATLLWQARNPLSRKAVVEIVAFAREGAQFCPGAPMAVTREIPGGPGMPRGAGEVDGVGWRVHVDGIGEDRGSVSGCLGVTDKRTDLSESWGKSVTRGRWEKGLFFRRTRNLGVQSCIGDWVSLGFRRGFCVECPIMASTHQSGPVSSFCQSKVHFRGSSCTYCRTHWPLGLFAPQAGQPRQSWSRKRARWRGWRIAWLRVEVLSPGNCRYLENAFWVDSNLGFDGRAVCVCLDFLFDTVGMTRVFIVHEVSPERLLSACVSSLLISLERSDHSSNRRVGDEGSKLRWRWRCWWWRNWDLFGMWGSNNPIWVAALKLSCMPTFYSADQSLICGETVHDQQVQEILKMTTDGRL